MSEDAGRILPRERGRRLLAAMDRLVAEAHAPLKGRVVPRGLYLLLYESWLGEETGGAAHLARSRKRHQRHRPPARLREPYRRRSRRSPGST